MLSLLEVLKFGGELHFKFDNLIPGRYCDLCVLDVPTPVQILGNYMYLAAATEVECLEF